MKTTLRLNGQRLMSLAAWAGYFCTADIAWAHSFSQRYDLPAPLWLYAFSVMATVMASVSMVDAFVRGESSRRRPRPYRRDDLRVGWSLSRWLVPPIAIGSVSVVVFIALLIASSIGNQSPAAAGFTVSAIEPARPVRITMPPGITFERCLTLTPDQTLFYRFQADQPLVFDIHYHAQNVRRYAIREHPANREARAYIPPSTQEYCLTWQDPASDPVAFSWAFTATTSDNRGVLTP